MGRLSWQNGRYGAEFRIWFWISFSVRESPILLATITRSNTPDDTFSILTHYIDLLLLARLWIDTLSAIIAFKSQVDHLVLLIPCSRVGGEILHKRGGLFVLETKSRSSRLLEERMSTKSIWSSVAQPLLIPDIWRDYLNFPINSLDLSVFWLSPSDAKNNLW